MSGSKPAVSFYIMLSSVVVLEIGLGVQAAFSGSQSRTRTGWTVKTQEKKIQLLPYYAVCDAQSDTPPYT